MSEKQATVANIDKTQGRVNTRGSSASASFYSNSFIYCVNVN